MRPGTFPLPERASHRFTLRVDPDGSDRVDNDSGREVSVAGLGVFPCWTRSFGDRHALRVTVGLTDVDTDEHVDAVVFGDHEVLQGWWGRE